MTVIGILVLLAMPKFMDYTEKARLTVVKSNIAQVETASEIYYMDHENWPKLSDKYYTAVQLKTFSQKILDKTAEEVTLDANGKYYPIDFDKLKSYVREPKDGLSYVIQNPIGEIYYIKGLTSEGKKELSGENNGDPSGNDGENPVDDENYTGSDFIVHEADEETVMIGGYSGTSIDMKIQSKINGKIVTTLENDAFSYMGLTSVIIPNSVNYIWERVFENNKLTSVTIGSNVTLYENSISKSFYDAYTANGYVGGTYTATSQTGTWTKQN